MTVVLFQRCCNRLNQRVQTPHDDLFVLNLLAVVVHGDAAAAVAEPLVSAVEADLVLLGGVLAMLSISTRFFFFQVLCLGFVEKWYGQNAWEGSLQLRIQIVLDVGAFLGVCNVDVDVHDVDAVLVDVAGVLTHSAHTLVGVYSIL